MAKKPTRPRRSVVPVSSEDLQPGTVGMALATREIGGVVPAGDDHDTATARKQSDQEKKDQFLAMARRRWRMSRDAESQLRKDMLDDLRFYNSEQWPDNIKMDRVLDGRPCLTINRLPQFVRQVLNQARQQRPAIQINPIDNGADPDTAEVIQGICRSIERNSNAPMAYNSCGESQVVIGRGWLRVRADWIDNDSFDQEILIEAPEDPFTVYPDPASGLPDGSDASHGFVIVRMPWHEYHVQYPDAERVSVSDWTSIGDDAPDWVNENGVLIAEYYYIESVAAELVEWSITMPDSTEPLKMTTFREQVPDDAIEIRSRKTTRRQLKWATINGIDILDGNEDKTGGRNLPGPFIPLVPMIGEKLMVNGRRNIRGMVRDAKDPQRTYNFWVSAETEMIALAPRAPVIGALGQFESTKEQWLQANRRNFPFLEYDPIDVNGNLVPAPQRNPFDPNVTPIIQATQQADQDLKSVIGMFDASQERSREQSGKAIIARQQQGEQGNSHFLSNQALAIQQVGRILLHWIPVYYDRPKVIRIVGIDDRERDVMVHAGQPDAAQEAAQADPLMKTVTSGALYDVGLGRYDVSVTVAPSFQSRRAESVEAIVQLLQAFPLAAPYALDILAENMDWPGARQLSERFKNLVPPEARDPKDGEPKIPPEVQQQIGQMKQQMELMGQQLQEQQKIIDTKAQELAMQGDIRRMEIAAQDRAAQLKAQLEMAKIAAEAQAEKELTLLKGRLDALQTRLELQHEDAKLLLPPVRPQESLNYRDAPPDVRRQIEAQAGLEPSKMKEQPPVAKSLVPTAAPKPKPKPKSTNGGGG
jgi:Phage P22-like portal protein